jgi:hypothetical protein
MTPDTTPLDEDAWQDPENFGERPELPAFDEDLIEAAYWRQQQEQHL